MKILWFTNSIMPAIYRHLKDARSSSGPWMETLAAQIADHPDIELTIVTAFAGLPDLNFKADNVHYRVVGLKKKLFHWTVGNEGLTKCATIVKETQPDLVHIHGTELQYGLLSAHKLINVPTIISIQGLIGPCSNHILGSLSLLQVTKQSKLMELIRGTSLTHQYFQYKKRGVREKEIIRKNKSFFGRTSWDKAHIATTNPVATYYNCGEILRTPFSKNKWKLDRCQKYSIIFTNVSGPLKGVDILIDAISILRKKFPRIKLRLAGRIETKSGYGKYLHKLFRQKGVIDCLEILGYLDAPAMAKQLASSHIFAIASHIENSPNSLAEAQVVGMPCVASYTGGIPSMISEGATGLLFPPGDAVMLADSIRKIFLDDDLATRLGNAAHKEACRRHNPEQVTSDLLTAYKDITTSH